MMRILLPILVSSLICFNTVLATQHGVRRQMQHDGGEEFSQKHDDEEQEKETAKIEKIVLSKLRAAEKEDATWKGFPKKQKIPSKDCRDVFNKKDWYRDGWVDCWDIESLHKDYGIPEDDIKAALRKYAKDSEDGQVQVTYVEFRDEFCG